ncbi:unnamed protein product [Pleuronectes platessa]|uniref:Uncharacterized protein n=1 Tax=Pleuronectes platessa TaxID=8262 RepID=A0A9N7V2I1_PLEPL|nr:unnamed protein product [Pleuronectes platessa]
MWAAGRARRRDSQGHGDPDRQATGLTSCRPYVFATRRGEPDRPGFASLRVTGPQLGAWRIEYTTRGARQARLRESQGHGDPLSERRPLTRAAARAPRREPSGRRDPGRRDSPTRASQWSYVKPARNLERESHTLCHCIQGIATSVCQIATQTLTANSMGKQGQHKG